MSTPSSPAAPSLPVGFAPFTEPIMNDAKSKSQFVLWTPTETLRVTAAEAGRLWSQDPSIVFDLSFRVAGTPEMLRSALTASNFSQDIIIGLLNGSIGLNNFMQADRWNSFSREVDAGLGIHRAIVTAGFNAGGVRALDAMAAVNPNGTYPAGAGPNVPVGAQPKPQKKAGTKSKPLADKYRTAGQSGNVLNVTNMTATGAKITYPVRPDVGQDPANPDVRKSKWNFYAPPYNGQPGLDIVSDNWDNYVRAVTEITAGNADALSHYLSVARLWAAAKGVSIPATTPSPQPAFQSQPAFQAPPTFQSQQPIAPPSFVAMTAPAIDPTAPTQPAYPSYTQGQWQQMQQAKASQAPPAFSQQPSAFAPSPSPAPSAFAPSPAPSAFGPSPAPSAFAPSPAPSAFAPSPAPSAFGPSPAPSAFGPTPTSAAFSPAPPAAFSQPSAFGPAPVAAFPPPSEESPVAFPPDQEVVE